ncbi:hypothetical protein [Sphingomonas sp. LHG3443-2]|uniref:hypothetical protein n=1 Tax=Sphingomonas sp. LHG3443-2 TaxID=2804639 RepID=UPI003CEF875F
MTNEVRAPEPSVLSQIVKAYLLGTLIAGVALHVTISIVAPGDAGTLRALSDGIILLLVVLMVGLVGLVAFPILALASWPLREMVLKQPLAAILISCVTGAFFGALITAAGLRVGPGDFYSGPLVGATFALVWYHVVRQAHLGQMRNNV